MHRGLGLGEVVQLVFSMQVISELTQISGIGLNGERGETFLCLEVCYELFDKHNKKLRCKISKNLPIHSEVCLKKLFS